VSEGCLQPVVLRIPLAGGYPIINTFIDTRRGGEHSGVGPMRVNELDIVVVRKGRRETILLRLQIHCACASNNIIVAGCCSLGFIEAAAASTHLQDQVGLMHHNSVSYLPTKLFTDKPDDA
jgi:hypothetical protein